MRLTIENDSPKGDRTVFLDAVEVIPVRRGSPVLLTNPGFDNPTDPNSSPCPGNADHSDPGWATNYMCPYSCKCSGSLCAFFQRKPQRSGCADTTPTGWIPSGGVVIVQNGAAPWGGLTSSDASRNYISLQGFGSSLAQTLTGLEPGATYIVAFQAAHRPGYGEDEFLHVKLGEVTIWEALHPADEFRDYSALFTATDSTETLRFENDSPEGDRSVFIDAVAVTKTLNGLAIVPPVASSETQLHDFHYLGDKMPWQDAEDMCVARGRHLASTHSEEESAFIASMHHGEDSGIYEGVWIGYVRSVLLSRFAALSVLANLESVVMPER